MTRKLGIAHLSMLDLDAPELIRVAAEAGFDFVGLRVNAATPAERWPNYATDEQALREVRAALDDTGLYVADIEFLPLGEDSTREQWLPILEAGAAIGAATLSVAGADTDFDRLADTLGALTEDARTFEIVPTLEAISYNPVARIEDAAHIARKAGAAVLVDALHLVRAGGSVADIAALEEQLVPVLQLCDGPLATPTELLITDPLPRSMTADGEPRKVESRALRLVPGEGEFPLDELVAAAPAGAPISVEVPNAPLRAELGATGYAERLYASVERYRLA